MRQLSSRSHGCRTHETRRRVASPTARRLKLLHGRQPQSRWRPTPASCASSRCEPWADWAGFASARRRRQLACMKKFLLSLNLWIWLRRRTVERCPPTHGDGVVNTVAPSDALRLRSSAKSQSNVDALTSAARARLTQLRANAWMRHRPEAVVPPTVFDESVFDEFTVQHRDAAQPPLDCELRTVFLPRDEAYATTVYLPRSDASAAAAGTH